MSRKGRCGELDDVTLYINRVSLIPKVVRTTSCAEHWMLLQLAYCSHHEHCRMFKLTTRKKCGLTYKNLLFLQKIDLFGWFQFINITTSNHFRLFTGGVNSFIEIRKTRSVIIRMPNSGENINLVAQKSGLTKIRTNKNSGKIPDFCST